MDNTDSVKKQGNLSLTIAAIIIIIAGIMYAASIVTSLLMALFIAIICAQPIYWLQKKKVSQGLAVAIVFVGILRPLTTTSDHFKMPQAISINLLQPITLVPQSSQKNTNIHHHQESIPKYTNNILKVYRK